MSYRGTTPGLRALIEAHLAHGRSVRFITDLTGASERYVEDLAVRFHARARKPAEVEDTIDSCECHADACIAEGGFPAAVVRDGRTYWEDMHGRPWNRPQAMSETCGRGQFAHSTKQSAGISCGHA